MERLIVERYMKLIEPLGYEVKLELIRRVIESLKDTFSQPESNPGKEKLLNELYGSWSDVGDEIIDEIYESRTISDRELDLD